MSFDWGAFSQASNQDAYEEPEPFDWGAWQESQQPEEADLDDLPGNWEPEEITYYSYDYDIPEPDEDDLPANFFPGGPDLGDQPLSSIFQASLQDATGADANVLTDIWNQFSDTPQYFPTEEDDEPLPINWGDWKQESDEAAYDPYEAEFLPGIDDLEDALLTIWGTFGTLSQLEIEEGQGPRFGEVYEQVKEQTLAQTEAERSAYLAEIVEPLLVTGGMASLYISTMFKDAWGDEQYDDAFETLLSKPVADVYDQVADAYWEEYDAGRPEDEDRMITTDMPDDEREWTAAEVSSLNYTGISLMNMFGGLMGSSGLMNQSAFFVREDVLEGDMSFEELREEFGPTSIHDKYATYFYEHYLTEEQRQDMTIEDFWGEALAYSLITNDEGEEVWIKDDWTTDPYTPPSYGGGGGYRYYRGGGGYAPRAPSYAPKSNYTMAFNWRIRIT